METRRGREPSHDGRMTPHEEADLTCGPCGDPDCPTGQIAAFLSTLSPAEPEGADPDRDE